MLNAPSVMRKNLPRHSAASFELKEGTGAITAMCPCGEFLEIYKIDKTFRVRSPEAIDPKETNPNAMWVMSPMSDVGSANPIVARILLQGHEMLKAVAFDREVDDEAVIKQLHSCKELLLACESAAKKTAFSIDSIIDQIRKSGLSRDSKGRGLNPFPQVTDLEAQCGAFLINANRVIKLVCELPQQFIPLDRHDSNFDYLAKRLEAAIGGNTPLVEFVKDNADGVRYLIDLRNFHEHPKEKRTVIENFCLMPDSSIRMPMWHLSDQEPRPIKDEMDAANYFLMHIAEAMLIHLVMHAVSRKFPYIIEEIPDDKVDEKAPIKYRLSLDISKLRMPT